MLKKNKKKQLEIVATIKKNTTSNKEEKVTQGKCIDPNIIVQSDDIMLVCFHYKQGYCYYNDKCEKCIRNDKGDE